MKMKLVVLAVVLVGCQAPEQRWETPDTEDPCRLVQLTDGHIDGSPEMRALFDCLNNLGSLAALEPLIGDLQTTINPDTSRPYLDDVAEATNTLLAYEDTARVLEVTSNLVNSGAIEKVTPLGAELIGSGLVDAILPVIEKGIEAGQVAELLPPAADMLRDPELPVLTARVRTMLDDGIADGWVYDLMDDAATVLTATDANGEPALRPVLEASAEWLASGGAEDLLPTVETLLADGTAEDLFVVLRTLYDDGILAELDSQLRPLFVQDEQGMSHMQGLNIVLSGTAAPLKCVGITITDNLAVMILETMADQTPASVQNLTSILQDTLGIMGFLCNLPDQVQEHFDSLDALANSGALDGLLPLLKVVKERERVPELVDVIARLHESGTGPGMEPVIVTMIDSGALDRMLGLLPHFVDEHGAPTDAAATIMDAMGGMVGSLGPMLTWMGQASGPAAHAMADAFYELGVAIDDPNSSFSDLPDALLVFLGSDPDGVMALVLADMIDDGVIDRALDPLAQSIRSGNAKAMLPWMERIFEDGTVDELVKFLAGALELVEAA